MSELIDKILMDKLNRLENPEFFENYRKDRHAKLIADTKRLLNEPPSHQNCKSEWSTMEVTFRRPTGRETLRSMILLELQLYNTPWWNLKRKLELRSAIRQEIINGIVWGHFVRKGKK